MAEYDGTSEYSGPPTPPNNKYAEQALLGGILIDDSQFEKITGFLSPDDFFQQRHRLIFDAFKRLYSNSENFDVVTIRSSLEQSGHLEEAGGAEYLIELARETPYAGHTESYANLVYECAVLRRILKGAQQIQKLVFDAGDSPAEDILSKSQHLIYKIGENEKSIASLQHVKEPASEALTKIEELFQNPNKGNITGIASGFDRLDFITSGFQESDLIVIAGRPGMGKTALALNIAEHAAIKGKCRVAIFSMEMSAIALATRSLSSLSAIDSKCIREGDFGEGDQADMRWSRLANAYNMLNEAEIYIDDTSGISPIDISARARRMARETGGLDLVVVDYLQLLQMESKENNRVTEVANITRELKFLAKDLEIPVIVLSQLSRAVEGRTNKRPVMADLRESGAIEQDADLILFIYRDEVYNQDSKDTGLAEINVAKHRNGDLGTFKLAFVKDCTRFENLSAFDYDD